MNNRALISTFIVYLLVGCLEDKTENNQFISVEQFESRVSNVAGLDSVNCGPVEIGQSSESTTLCVSEAFVNGVSFYAVYMQQGTDSTVALAVSMNSNGKMEFWLYDSSTSGGGNSGPSLISSSVCHEPMFTGQLQGNHYHAFECS